MSELTLRQRLRFVVLRYSYIYAVCVGILSLRYDFKRRQIVYCKWLRIYACVMNVLVLVVGAYASWHTRHLFNFYGNNQVMQLTNVVNIYVRFWAVFMTLLLRWRREQRAKDIVNALLRLEWDYFEAIKVEGDIEKRFDCMLFRKYVMLWLQLITMILASVTNLNNYTWLTFLTKLYFICMLHMLYAVMFHYFMALLHICKRFSILNARLAEIHTTLNEKDTNDSIQRALSVELDSVAMMHYRLSDLLQQLNDCYKFQVMALMLSQIIKTITMGYFGVMICSGNVKIKTKLVQYFIGAVLYASNAYSSMLMDLLCDTLEREGRLTLELLQRFNQFERLHPDLERSCTSLAQQLSLRKIQVNIAGMFNLNRNAIFHICSGIILHTIILLQFDMKERLGYSATA